MSDRKKVALVTGASLGIGFALAKELASRGYQVYAGARRLAPMEPLKQYGVIPIELDVSLLDLVQKTKQYFLQHAGDQLDLLVNNAGTLCSFACTDLKDTDAIACYQVNVFGPMRMVKEFAPLLIKAQGTITFTGSVTGVVAFPFSAGYNSLKAAIHQYAATLRLEMKPFNVKVLNVVTGGVDTNIADTRPMPKDSYYNLPSLLDAFEERKLMAKRNAPMSAPDYAREVANDIERLHSTSGPLNYYRGTMAWFLGHLLWWAPRWVVEKGLLRKFGLTQGFKQLYQQYVVQRNYKKD